MGDEEWIALGDSVGFDSICSSAPSVKVGWSVVLSSTDILSAIQRARFLVFVQCTSLEYEYGQLFTSALTTVIIFASLPTPLTRVCSHLVVMLSSIYMIYRLSPLQIVLELAFSKEARDIRELLGGVWRAVSIDDLKRKSGR